MAFEEMEKSFIETELNKEETEIPSDPKELAEAMQRDWDSGDTPPTLSKTSQLAEEETTKKQHEVWEDLGSAMYDWAKGAIAGAEEVSRAASARGANLPAVGGGQNNHSKGGEKRPILGKLRTNNSVHFNLLSIRFV